MVNWIILKIAERCNLDCSYCYVYNRGDDSWRSRPAFMSEVVARQIAVRISEHSAKYGMDSFVIELHGGEPLLVGKAHMRALLELFRARCAPTKLEIVLQTNGLLLDEGWLDLFEQYGVRFGISLDGPPRQADKYRIFAHGGGSTRQLLAIIDRLREGGQKFERLLSGVLCVIDPGVDGADLVRWFVSQGFKSFDFLLPDGTYVNPPQGWNGAQEYKKFLIQAFDEWYGMGDDAPKIRLFEMMMMGLMGVRPRLDALGGDLSSLCVIESDGAIGLLDVIRICGGEFANDVLNVFTHPLDAHADHYRLSQIQAPSEQCRRCPHFSSCRGGYLPHRFDGRSFDNPSLYCEALYALSERMMAALRSDLPASVWREPGGSGQV